MPLILDQFLPSGARLLIWNTLETQEELEKFIPEAEIIQLKKAYRHPLRRVQKIVTSLLLNKLCNNKRPALSYNQLGKPSFKNFQGHLSISHSKSFVGLLYHAHFSCGLDLEEPDVRILRIKDRFLNEFEKNYIVEENIIRDSLLIWSVKEALFKNIGCGGILFKEHLTVHPPETKEGDGGSGIAYYNTGTIIQKFNYAYINLEHVQVVHTIASERSLEQKHDLSTDIGSETPRAAHDGRAY